MQRGRRRRQRAAIAQRLERSQVFYLDHESPSLGHEHFALEEYTVTANYGCVNIWTSKSVVFRISGALAALAHPGHLLQ